MSRDWAIKLFPETLKFPSRLSRSGRLFPHGKKLALGALSFLAVLCSFSMKDSFAGPIANQSVSSLQQSGSAVHQSGKAVARTALEKKAAQALDLGSYTEVVQMLSRENSPYALYLVGQAYERADSPEWAKPYIERAATLAPGDSALSAWAIWVEIYFQKLDRASLHCIRELKRFPNDANILAVHGLTLFKQNKSEQGMALLKKAIRQDPRNFLARRFLSECYIFQLEKEKAASELDQLVKFYPRNAQSYLLRARLHQELGEFPQALKDYEVVERLNPHCPYLNYRRARMNLERRELKLVLADLNKCFGPESSAPLMEKARRLRITYYELTGEERLAVKDLDFMLKGVEKMSDIDSASLSWLADRGKAHLQLKDYKGAIRDSDIILRSKPQDCDALYNRARAYAATGKILLALNDLNRLIEQDDNVPQWYRERAAVMDKLGRSAMAKRDRERAAVIEKSHEP